MIMPAPGAAASTRPTAAMYAAKTRSADGSGVGDSVRPALVAVGGSGGRRDGCIAPRWHVKHVTFVSPPKRDVFRSTTIFIISRARRFACLSSRSHTQPPTFDGVRERSGLDWT